MIPSSFRFITAEPVLNTESFIYGSDARQEKVVLIGMKKTVEHMVNNNRITRRYTVLSNEIKELVAIFGKLGEKRGRTRIMTAAGFILRQLYAFLLPSPPVCGFCGARKAHEEDECGNCIEERERLVCSTQKDGAYACYYYDSIIKDFIHRLSTDARNFYAKRLRAKWKS